MSAFDALILHFLVEDIECVIRELPVLSIVSFTHDLSEGMSLDVSICIMMVCSLIAHGVSREILKHPRIRFSADFLGRANI
ncbi:2-aminoethylphosphonate ABC transport system ATP-binding subunit PhnT, partial [Salmonella enterica subsp. enterica serovar Infantis]